MLWFPVYFDISNQVWMRAKISQINNVVFFCYSNGTHQAILFPRRNKHELRVVALKHICEIAAVKSGSIALKKSWKKSEIVKKLDIYIVRAVVVPCVFKTDKTVCPRFTYHIPSGRLCVCTKHIHDFQLLVADHLKRYLFLISVYFSLSLGHLYPCNGWVFVVQFCRKINLNAR